MAFRLHPALALGIMLGSMFSSAPLDSNLLKKSSTAKFDLAHSSRAIIASSDQRTRHLVRTHRSPLVFRQLPVSDQNCSLASAKFDARRSLSSAAAHLLFTKLQI